MTHDDRDDEQESGGQEPKAKRRRPLDTLERVRREMSAIYHQAKTGTMPIDKAKGLTYLLSQISATLKAETNGEGELAALLAQVREKLKGRA